MSIFGQRLRSLRKSAGHRQEDLAQKLGISQSAIGMYERGEREPSIEIIQNIANLYGVTTDYLLGQTDEPTTNEKVKSALNKIDNALDPRLDRKYADVFLSTLEQIFHMSQEPDFPEKQEEVFQVVLDIIRGMMVEGKKIPEPILDILLVSLEKAKEQMINEEKNKPSSEG